MAPRQSPYLHDRMAHLLSLAGITPVDAENERFPMLKSTYAKLNGNGSSRSREQLWKNIYSTFYKLKAWFIDKDAWEYHAFGWQVHRKGGNLTTNLEIVLAEMSKLLPDAEGKDLYTMKELYTENKDQAVNLLFLFNVAYCWRRGLKYNFAEHAKVSTWSLEHIHAQNQVKLSSDDLKLLGNWEYSEYESACTDDYPNGSDWLRKKIGESYPEDDNSLKNLALLARDDNASLNNGFYIAKRRDVVSWLQHWIPDASWAVFTKSLPRLNVDIPYWGEDDRKAYVAFIQDTIQSFCKGEK